MHLNAFAFPSRSGRIAREFPLEPWFRSQSRCFYEYNNKKPRDPLTHHCSRPLLGLLQKNVWPKKIWPPFPASVYKTGPVKQPCTDNVIWCLGLDSTVYSRLNYVSNPQFTLQQNRLYFPVCFFKCAFVPQTPKAGCGNVDVPLHEHSLLLTAEQLPVIFYFKNVFPKYYSNTTALRTCT